MESVPGTSGNCPISPPKKRRHLGHLTLAEKQAILNMYKKLKIDNPTKSTRTIVSEIVAVIGVVRSTVYKVICEYKRTRKLSSPKQSSGRRSLLFTMDDDIKNAVRRVVHSFFHKNEAPTLNKILAELQNHPNIPQMSRSTLYLLLKKINFRYMKRSRNSLLIERNEISTWRYRYLTSIKSFRNEQRKIFYLDETWVNEGHSKTKVWVDTNIHSRRQAFVEGITTGLKNPTGKGKRLIVTHIGSEDGFVEGGLHVFESKKTGDYHEDMNSVVFEDWFSDILEKLPENAVIVMDNAPYHSRKIERVPTSSSTKKDMQVWLESKQIPFLQDMCRPVLLDIIRKHKDCYNRYVIDDMAAKKKKHVLRLPPYHCELNAIELVWAQIKNEVAAKNTTYKMKDVKELLLNAIANIDSEKWKRCIEHVIKEEEKMRKLDGLIDDIVEPFIISTVGDSDTDDMKLSD